MWKEVFVFSCDNIDFASSRQILMTYKRYNVRDRILSKEYIDVYLEQQNYVRKKYNSP